MKNFQNLPVLKFEFSNSSIDMSSVKNAIKALECSKVKKTPDENTPLKVQITNPITPISKIKEFILDPYEESRSNRKLFKHLDNSIQKYPT